MRFILAALIIVQFWLHFGIPLVAADVGTATSYDPPYIPTRCRLERDKLPGGGFFVAASDGVWDNGAACGRRYRVRCISGLRRPCIDKTIVVEVIDACRTNPCPATLLLSNTAFDFISKIPNARVNVEFVPI